MVREKQNEHDMNQPEADLLLPVLNHDPEGKLLYHPAIGKGAVWGGLIGGILIGVLTWLIASGVWPIAGLGQIAAGTEGSAAFFGFAIGSAVGGLIGSLNGIKYMFLDQEDCSSEP